MGYRSEVAYRIVFGNDDVMKLFLAEAKNKVETAMVFKDAEEDTEESITIRDKDREIYFHVHGWKWYDEFELVQAHLALLDLAKEYNERQVEVNKTEHDGTEVTELGMADDVSYAFARIGEDMGDNDIWGSDDYWELLDIERHIRVY